MGALTSLPFPPLTRQMGSPWDPEKNTNVSNGTPGIYPRAFFLYSVCFERDSPTADSLLFLSWKERGRGAA